MSPDKGEEPSAVDKKVTVLDSIVDIIQEIGFGCVYDARPFAV